MIRRRLPCISCADLGCVSVGPGPSDIDACRLCAAIAEADYQGRERAPVAQLAMVLPFAERRAA
jgi:hypothetical protein